jgi:hypothetical protein
VTGDAVPEVDPLFIGGLALVRRVVVWGPVAICVAVPRWFVGIPVLLLLLMPYAAWDAAALEEGSLPADQTGPVPPVEMPPPPVPAIEPAELRVRLGEIAVVDLGPSPVYRAGPVPGAGFVALSWLADLRSVPGTSPLMLTSADRRLAGGNEAWAREGFELNNHNHAWASRPDDVYRRPYEGTDNPTAAMQAHIDWEIQLVAQLANDGISGFHVVR